MLKEITQKIIDLLKANENLSEPNKIAKYYFGIPKRIEYYPIIYVQLNSREYAGKADINRFLYSLKYEIGIVDRQVNEDDAEKSVYDKIEHIEVVLDANPTLDNLVIKELEPREIRILRAVEEDFAIAWAQIFASWRVWLP